jgi:hypothetical protein
MGARQKLNSINATGCLALAAVIGALTESWAVFLTVAALLIAGSIHAGHIRPDRMRR